MRQAGKLKPIVVIGSINMDLVVCTAHLPRPGETIMGHAFQTFRGGKGANQAVAVARLGHPVALIGTLGRDRFGQELLAGLVSEGVLCDSVERCDVASGVASITIEEGGQNSIVVVPGANARLTAADIERRADLIGSAGMVLLQLEIPMECVEAACAVAARAGVPVMLDPAPARRLGQAVLERVEWLTPNETEALPIVGQTGRVESDTEAELVAVRLKSLGARNVVVKMGGRGSHLTLSDGTSLHVPPIAVEVRDTTAAGDTYNGAFAVALLRGMNATAAARYASTAAGISVTREGAQPAMPRAAEVTNFIAR